MSLAALVAIGVMILVFPDFWWGMWRAGRLVRVCLLGAICSGSMFAVGTGWGLVHLAGRLSTRLRREAKLGPAPAPGGVWDRELDEFLPTPRRDA